MLVVGAEDDRHCPAAIVRKVWKKYRHVAEYKQFPRHAHWVIGEDGWQEVAQFCAEWLENQAPPATANATS
jgi:pimeloyl-ACP methyl ester carboxylesterase